MQNAKQTQSESVDSTRRQFLCGVAGGVLAGGLAGCGWRAPAVNRNRVENNEKPEPSLNEPAAASGKRKAYTLFRVEGTHQELGRQHGEQAAEQIKAHLDYMARSQKLTRAQLHARSLKFQPLFDEYCPHLLEEVRGLAEGAGIPLAEALAVNIRGALSQVQHEGCTTYVIGPKGTASGEVLIGQNSDMLPPMLEMGSVLYLKPLMKPELLIWTFGGMIGYHGMNSAGVAHFANDVGGGPKRQFALPHYPVKRLMLECANVDEVVALLRKVPLWANGNYVLCDGSGNILDVETTTEGPKLLRDRARGFLAHTNHFLSTPYACQENFDRSLPDSFSRLKRMNELIAGEFGSITAEDMQGFLADHADHPTSICRHPGRSDLNRGFQTAGQTVASMVAEPAQRRMHVCFGNPCRNRFTTYAMDGS